MGGKPSKGERQVLGRGTYGMVFKEGENAVKEIALIYPGVVKSAQDELFALTKIPAHPNLVRVQS